MSSNFNIYVSDIHLYAKIGVDDQERKVGHEFCINLCITINTDEFKEEDLSTSISYVELYDIIKAEMDKESMLLESVTKRISDKIQLLWPSVEEIRIRIDKLAPPIPGIQGTCGVEHVFKR